MSDTKKMFRLTLVSAALATAFSAVHADDEGVNALIKPDSSISVGLGNWSHDRPQLGMYDGMRYGRTYGLIDLDIVKRLDDSGTWFKLRAVDLGLDTREIRGEYLRQGNFGVSLDYGRIPRDTPYNISTRLVGYNSTNQIVSTTADPGPLQTAKLGTERDVVGLGVYKNLAPGLDFNFTFKNEEKTGLRHWGRGGQAEFAVEPIDSTTRQAKATLSYASKIFQLSGGYAGSWYNNENRMVSMTNAGLPVNNANTTYLSLPLDNEAHQVFLNGGFNFTPTTRATMKMSYQRAFQNEPLPTSDIPGLAFAAAPLKLDGQINTTLLQFGVTSRPIKDLSILANLRYHNVDDVTPTNRFVQTNAACASGQCVDNTPMSYKTITGKLEGTYRLPAGFSLTAGVEERQQDRTVPVSNANGAGGTDTQRVVPMRTDLDETTWRVELRRSLSDVLNGSLSYLNSQRSGSSYVFAAGPGNSSNNGFANISNQINPINIADRERNKIRVALDWSPLDSLSFQFNAEEGRDKYDVDNARPFGLEEGKVRIYGVDASYMFADKWRVNAWYAYDRSEATQKAARASNGGGNAAVKDYDLEDVGHAFGLGLRGVITSRISLGADLSLMRNVSKYQQGLNPTDGSAPTSTVANFAPGLPNVENKLSRLSIFTIYSLDKSSDLRLDVISERWKSDDWSWMFANGSAFSYGTTTDGTTVSADPRQSASFVGLRYIYKFQ